MRNTWGRVTTGLGWALFALWAWAPLGAWMGAWITAPDLWRLAAPGGRRLESLAATLLYALTVSLLASAIGGVAALYCWRRHDALARTAEWTALLALPFPPYLHAMAWLPLLTALPERGAGWPSATWVQTAAMLPYAFGLTRLALEHLDPRWLDAARVYGGDQRMLRGVLLPALAPAALAGFALVFLLTLADPAAPSLFSRSAYSLEIFADFSASHDAARALWMSTPLIAAGLLALEPLRRYWCAIAQRPSPDSAQQSPIELPGLSAGAALMALPALALVAAILKQAWPPGAWKDALELGWRDAAASAGSALVAALAVLPAAFLISRFLTRRHSPAWWCVSAPLAAPGALAGAGLIWLWNRDLPWTPYGTFWMLPLAALARFAPLAILAAAAWRARLDPLLLDAARVYAPPRRRIAGVELPLLWPGLAVGAAAVFALSLAELPATLLVVPPGSGTLALRIYNYLHYGASGSVAALSVCLMGATAASAWCAAHLWRRLP